MKGKNWPSLGSRISTVAVAGNSITPITGSESKIWKVSACSYFPSVSIRTRHVALVCPGLNCTCLWDLPLKSSSFFALPSWVPMPERQRVIGGKRTREQAWLVTNNTDGKKWRQKKKATIKGWQAEERNRWKTDEIFTPFNVVQRVVRKRALRLFFFTDHLQSLRNVWNESVTEAFK